MSDRIKKESDLIVVAVAEEFGYKKNMEMSEVLKLFEDKGIFELLRSQYDVLHTLDLSEGTEYVEDYLARSVA
ncbi:MAG: DUF3791 domain-containing protein [Oscillospiraceae bacterium]|nr:DUF3791 domain-containing protein [Oscillospiraceae bacterium]